MNWTAPAYSRTKVDRAGEMLANAAPEIPALREALLVISNWRSSHSFPLNTLQMSLRDKAALVEDRRVIAQRLKRLSSIQLKLRRFPTMTLSQMQDIGGCRAILSSVPRVRELVRIFGDAGFKHALARKDDYITTPKASGYRSVHLIYRYHSDRNATYNGLQIEMQLRSQLQHAWATAVETVGTFLDQALKSSFGSARWLRFFTVMGSAIAHRERSPLVPGTPQSRGALARELRELGRELRRHLTNGVIV